MRLGTYRDPHSGEPTGGVLVDGRIVGLAIVRRVTGRPLAGTVSAVIRSGELGALRAALAVAGPGLRHQGHSLEAITMLAPYTDPPKIWCIGLNYRDHAADLNEQSPDEPASFMRPACSIRGPGEPIRLPPDSARVTGEAELAVVLGRRCKHVSRGEAHAAIAAIVPAIDMTAEDVLRRNPRFLTRAKSYDTFLSIGPFLVTPDELGDPDALRAVEVSTLLNGQAMRSNTGANMRHDVYDLIAFHSRVFTWEPGDLLLTGTPGAVVIRDGDVIGCRLGGIATLENPVAGAADDAGCS